LAGAVLAAPGLGLAFPGLAGTAPGFFVPAIRLHLLFHLKNIEAFNFITPTHLKITPEPGVYSVLVNYIPCNIRISIDFKGDFFF